MMKILAMETELQSPAGEGSADLYKHEARQVYALYLSGALREIYLTQANSAVLVLECESLAEAERLLNTLPLVQAGAIAFTVHELRPYRGYGRLMQ
jgi:hypothetical protein